MNRASFLGLLFIVAGILVLLVSFEVLQGGFAMLWIISILLVNSCFFILSRDRLTWGQRVFGFMLLSVGATGVAGDKAGLIVVTSASLGFFLSYFFGSKRSWWLLVPAGIFSGIALYFWLGELLPVWDAIPIMLLMFSGTFTLLYLLPNDYGGREWALLPALGLIVLTVVSNDPLERRATLLIIIFLVIFMLVAWSFMRRRRAVTLKNNLNEGLNDSFSDNLNNSLNDGFNDGLPNNLANNQNASLKTGLSDTLKE